MHVATFVDVAQDKSASLVMQQRWLVLPPTVVVRVHSHDSIVSCITMVVLMSTDPLSNCSNAMQMNPILKSYFSMRRHGD